MTPAPEPCPCGRKDARGRVLPLPQCCGRHLGDREGTPAPDAETLMRSRYTAFVREDAPYLLATWHASTRPLQLTFEPGLKWLGLEVQEYRPIDDDHAEVAFVARSRLAGRGQRLQERSRFVREAGRWYYVDGDLS